jgi:hypothetical protein
VNGLKELAANRSKHMYLEAGTHVVTPYRNEYGNDRHCILIEEPMTISGAGRGKTFVKGGGFLIRGFLSGSKNSFLSGNGESYYIEPDVDKRKRQRKGKRKGKGTRKGKRKEIQKEEQKRSTKWGKLRSAVMRTNPQEEEQEKKKVTLLDMTVQMSDSGGLNGLQGLFFHCIRMHFDQCGRFGVYANATNGRLFNCQVTQSQSTFLYIYIFFF